MQNFRSLSLVLLCYLFVSSCGKSLPALEGFTHDVWKQDMNPCNHKRTAMRESVKQQKDKLLGLDEMDILNMLGKPDENELYTRNQKFYHYYLEPSPACSSMTAQPGSAEKLTLRFNALGLVKEVTVN